MSNCIEKTLSINGEVWRKSELNTVSYCNQLVKAGYSLAYSDLDNIHPPGFGVYSEQQPTTETILLWFGGRSDRNIELQGAFNGTYALDFDNKDGRHGDRYQKFIDLVLAKFGPSKQQEAIRLLMSCMHMRTKSDGAYRIVWRCGVKPACLKDSGKTVLAYDEHKGFIELLTRFIVPGGCNSNYRQCGFRITGRSIDYTSSQLINSDDLLITDDLQELLIDVAESLDVTGPKPSVAFTGETIEGDSLGNRFNTHVGSNPDAWETILEGWSVCRNGRKKTKIYFNRPGANTGNCDATADLVKNVLWVESTSVEKLDCCGSVPFTVLTKLHFNGDFKAAAKAVAVGWNGFPALGTPLAPIKAGSGPLFDGETGLCEASDMIPDEADGKKESKACTSLLLGLIKAEAKPFRSIDQEDWVTLNIDGHFENMKLFSMKFETYLYGRCLAVHGKFPNEADIKKVLKATSFDCRTNPEVKVYTRVARVDDRIYLDLGTSDWSAIEITSSGWRVITDVPVKFRRGKNMGVLPKPVTGGSIDQLRPITGCTDEDWLLIVGLILDAFKGHGPYLVGVVTGQQGSAKSWLCELIRTVVDPLKYAPLCSLPTDEKSLAIGATQDYMLAFDNVSHLPSWLSDSLCRISTGGGLKSRELYTDSEQCVLSVCNPVLLNGIPDFAEAADLLSRAVIIQQPVIDERSRLQKDELLRKLEVVKSQVFGAILDLLVSGLRDCKSVKCEKMPRQADSAAWVTACLGNKDFLDCYFENQDDAIESSLDSSPIAPALKEYFSRIDAVEIYESSAVLLVRLRKLILNPDQHFPRTPRALVNRLKRDAPALRAIGIEFELDRKKTGRKLRLYNTNIGFLSSGDA